MKQRKNNILDEAELNIDEIAQYYAGIDPKLERDFLLKNNALLQRIKNTPEQFPKVYKKVRKGLLKRFPYMILFVMRPVENVIISAFHQRSNPNKWKNRADENLK